MSILDALISKVVPYDCLGCGLEGRLLCTSCLTALKVPGDHCYRCRRPSFQSLTCEICLVAGGPRLVRAAVVYSDPAKKLIWRLKSNGAQAAAAIMAARMLPLLAGYENTLIVSIPTATSRVRQRGYDQTRLVARQLAKASRLPWIDCLSRDGQAHQVGAGREQRLQQLESAFRVTQKRFVRGAHIILIDDVVTTGATLEAAAHVLKQAGAAQIDAIAFATPDFRGH